MIGKKINQLATELAPASTDLTIIGNPTTGVSKKITLAQLGAIFSGAVSFYTNLASFPATGTLDVIFCAKDTKKLYLWSGSAYVEVFPSQALLDTYQLRSEKGNANGYASLDSSGKVPVSQLPSSIMEYKGTWSAATNTPTLANGTGDTGDVYICNAAGTVNFGAGPITFAVGDYVIYSGTIWQRSSGAVGTVTSVGITESGDALTITGSPITTSGTINIGFAGTGAQYIKGDGTLATFPSIISQAQNLVTEVYNNSGATLTKGTIVYINGGQGNLPTVAKALATGDSTSAQTFGVVQADITNMNNGYVVVAGRISDLDTQAYTEGTQLYLSPTTAGTWTSTKPYAPQHLVYVGIVVRAHPTQGVVEVKIQNGYEMDELHNVSAQNPNNGDILQYVSSTSLWTKVAGTTSNIAEGSNLYYTDARSRAALSFTAGSGAYNSTTGVITIPTNTNQLTNGAAYITLASLSAGAGISYNNTTGVIASTITQYTDAMARAAISGGTGISYNSTTGVITNTITQYTDAMARASISLTTTGTSGAATYNSTTGVLNIPNYAPDLSGYVPTSRTLTINGTAYDLSANRSWSVGTVTSVGLSSATSGVTIGSTPVTTSGTITLAIATASGSQQGLLSSTDWTTFNNKQNALTNPVTGTGTTNYLPKFTGTSTIGNSLLQEGTNAIGLGVTPSAWASNSTVLQITKGTSIESLNNVFDYSSLNTNLYFNSSRNPIYLGNGYASRYFQYEGSHSWQTAPSGTAGNAISFTQAMTLNASGNLSIGNTNDTYKLDVSGTGRFTGQLNIIVPSGTAKMQIGDGSVSGGSYINLMGVAAAKTWFISNNYNLGGGLEFIQSTANGGTTPSNTAIFSLSSTGAATFSSSVEVAGESYVRWGLDNSAGLSRAWGIRNGYNSSGDFAIVSSSTNNTTLNTTRLQITRDGNVGIGTTTPAVRLDVADFGAVISGTATIGSNMKGIRVYNNTSAAQNNAVGIWFSTGPHQAGIASFRATPDTTWETTLAFYTHIDTTSNLNDATEKMRITGNGNVGIGTTSPANLLSLVQSNSASSTTLDITNSSNASTTTKTAQLLFSISDTANSIKPAASIIAYPDGVNNISSGMYFSTRSGDSGPFERMRITSGGAVEIQQTIQTGAPTNGTAQPWKLGNAVSGSISTDSYIIVSVNGTTYSIPALNGLP